MPTPASRAMPEQGRRAAGVALISPSDNHFEKEGSDE